LSSAKPPPVLLPGIFDGSEARELWPVDSTIIDLIECTFEEPADVGKEQSRWPFAVKSPQLRVCSISELLDEGSVSVSNSRDRIQDLTSRLELAEAALTEKETEKRRIEEEFAAYRSSMESRLENAARESNLGRLCES